MITVAVIAAIVFMYSLVGHATYVCMARLDPVSEYSAALIKKSDGTTTSDRETHEMYLAATAVFWPLTLTLVLLALVAWIIPAEIVRRAEKLLDAEEPKQSDKPYR